MTMSSTTPPSPFLRWWRGCDAATRAALAYLVSNAVYEVSLRHIATNMEDGDPDLDYTLTITPSGTSANLATLAVDPDGIVGTEYEIALDLIRGELTSAKAAENPATCVLRFVHQGSDENDGGGVLTLFMDFIGDGSGGADS